MEGRIKNYDKLVPADKNTNHKKQVLSEVGRIRIGAKATSQNGTQYPTSVDHFIIDSRYAKMVTDKYGEKTEILPIRFYSDDFNDVCYERLEIRDRSGKLFGFGDGEIFGIWNDSHKKYVTVDSRQRPEIMDDTRAHLIQGLTSSQANQIKWEPVLTLRFFIEGISALGYWEFSTKAVKTTIPNLRDRFDQCMELFKTVKWFPFHLSIKKVKSNKPGDSRTYPIVDIIPAFSMETGLQLANYIQEHGSFNQAKIALMDLNNLGADSNTKLLLGE